jgi:FMN-dependent oxidoreductase (nitrilotriacetate monooxygenase family)
MAESTTMHLAADLSHIHTDYLWRSKGCWEGYPYYGAPDLYEDCARLASRGKMDMLFFGDSANTSENHGGNHHAAVQYGMRWPKHDMMPLVPLMARAAKGVGFGLTMSTTYQHPFHVARLFNSLDHVTGGRMAWNAVTSAYKNEAANWGYEEMIDHDERYVKAREHMEVACALWDSVEADAIVFDKESGIFADPKKVHLINHKGKYFNVRGPLPVIPSPQGRPVLIQAGQSPAGMDLAATLADYQFVSRSTIESMKKHRATLDERLKAHNRGPRDLGVFWSIRIQVADSEAHAIEKEERYIESIPPQAGLIELSHMYGLDFSSLPNTMPLSEVGAAVKAQNVHWGSFAEQIETNDPKMTIGEFGRKNAIGRTLALRGTPKAIADRMEELHDTTGQNGGFILAKGIEVPGNLRDFVDYVVPELQRRGLTKTEYTGATLRENLN